MQQHPANMSGARGIVLTQTAAPIEIPSRYRNMTIELSRKFTTLGQAHIGIGGLCIIYQIVSLAFWNQNLGAGIWTGSLFIVTGAFGLSAGKKGGKCQVITFHVLSTISASFALVLLCCATTFAATSRRGPCVKTMESLLVLASVAEGIVAIYSSVICCSMGACCCNCGGSCCCPTDPEYNQFVDPVQPDLAQQQFIAGNQQPRLLYTNHRQPTFNTNEQQQMFNPNPQHAALSPNQQWQMLSTNQQQPMFMTSQQRLMASQELQQTMFNHSHQQQLLFTTNQQQPMFLQNQPKIGFHPQQYAAVQQLAHQSNVSSNLLQSSSSASLPGTTDHRSNTVENTGLSTTCFPADSNSRISDESPLASLNRVSNSQAAIPDEAPPPYDYDSGWNYSHV